MSSGVTRPSAPPMTICWRFSRSGTRAGATSIHSGWLVEVAAAGKAAAPGTAVAGSAAPASAPCASV